ncbi:hypothetical protein C2S53_003715 [Perilla frutescens var. hirtella]|uniref:Cellulose synthase-like protein E6 n=1 Tax=Perilla frutescens var. hirtella TaxID=608512 RepID=A0AAD4JPP9_PERFH|nr:hypothetical protein C2S53_003715 [Perilla frutescens var. hirtella]
MEKNEYLPLFESKAAKGRGLYWVYAVSMMIGISLICIDRVTHFPGENGVRRWAWTGIFMAELWFIIYWIITQCARCRAVFRYTFKDRLSRRYEDVLPGIDIFVSTADPQLEPPLMVVDTVLSVMAYDYPSEKLNVYLSDDGCSDLMFYALLEASKFSRFWLPFCRNFNVEPRAPSKFFSTVKQSPDQQWKEVKKLYDEMEARINDNMKLGRVPDQLRKHHKGFHEWELGASRSDHRTILQVIIDGRDTKEADTEGKPLPTLVYLAREKRPGYPHNFKAGAMNALIRVSSRISNSQIILNIDCDHYSNNSQSVRDALCFFMDDEQSRNISFVQFPQRFDNITKNDLYGSCLRVPQAVELAALDAHGGAPYIGSCCFHRRDALSGKKYENESHINWKQLNEIQEPERENLLEETAKFLANCSYEENSSWGKEMGFMYGCPVEDIVTGLSIQRKGWRSVFFNPKREGFMGLAPTTLLTTLIQHTRWSEGHIQIALSKYCPLIYGHGKIPVPLQISYLCYNLWAANCLATLYYAIVPPVCVLKGINLFPQVSSTWVLPYAYVFVAKHTYSLGEFLWSGGTLKGWYNDQRMWLYKRLTCYFYGFCLTILRSLGFTKLNFTITGKNSVDDDVSKRFEQEIMEFGTASSMFVILATIALFNLLTSISIARSLIIKKPAIDLDSYALHILLNGLVVIINLPLFEALFFRKDQGCMPASVTYQSLIFAALAFLLTTY